MPDVWTANREKLLTIFKELGAECGQPARVIAPRDADWTCYIDSKGWIRDVYIHDLTEFYYSGHFVSYVVFCSGLCLLLGLLWGKRFWKRQEKI